MTNFPDGRGVEGVAQSEIEREKQGDGLNLIGYWQRQFEGSANRTPAFFYF
jgi:hypothetical protein